MPKLDHAARSIDEISQLGSRLLRERIEPFLHPSDAGKFAVIDVDSCEYEIGEDDLAVVGRLRARLPEAQTFLGRVGSTYTFSSGILRPIE